MNRALEIWFVLLVFISCSTDKIDMSTLESENTIFISAVDLSRYPEIAISKPVFYDLDGNQNNFLEILKNNGVNTVRLRLWVNPNNGHSGFNEVKQFSKTLKKNGFKTWLTLHYSNTWADPAHQETPTDWQGVGFAQLKDSVYCYTEKVAKELQPDYIQIGNEINTGFLHPNGHILTQFLQFKELMDTAILAVRRYTNDTQIILHFAGIEGADWFYKQVSILDYDIMGLSYYPIWHGKSFSTLKQTMLRLSDSYNKKIIIAETAYPFTLQWNDWTNNIVGLDEQLILPEYTATPTGQKNFIKKVKTLTNEMENGIGFCYWGAELIAWKGNQSMDASPWENQALFDFNNVALPVLKEFKNE